MLIQHVVQHTYNMHMVASTGRPKDINICNCFLSFVKYELSCSNVRKKVIVHTSRKPWK